MKLTSWQDLAAIGVTAVAAGHVVWSGVRLLRARQEGCGTCGNCPKEGNAETLVSLALPTGVPASAGAPHTSPQR